MKFSIQKIHLIFSILFLCWFLLSSFTIFQYSESRKLSELQEIEKITSEAELLFLNELDQFEKFIIVAARKFKLSTITDPMISIIEDKFLYLNNLSIIEINENKNDFKGGNVFIENPSLYPLLETSKIYGSIPVYGAGYEIENKTNIPFSIFIDNVGNEGINLLGFLELKEMIAEVNAKNDNANNFTLKFLPEQFIDNSAYVGQFYSDKLMASFHIFPTSEFFEKIDNWNNIFVIMPLVFVPLVLLFFLWSESNKRRILETQLSTQLELAEKSSKLVFLGEIITSVAHEINQPLAALVFYATSLKNKLKQKNFSRKEIIDVTESIMRCSRKTGEIMHSTLNLATSKNTEKETLNVSDIVNEIMPLLEIQAKANQGNIVLNIPRDLSITCNKVAMEQIFLNLCRNGFDAMKTIDKKRTLEIKGYKGNIIKDSRKQICLEFINNRNLDDKGLDLNVLSTPFFSTKKEGVGLGINICKNLLEKEIMVN